MVDIDRYKEINDRFGHPSPDRRPCAATDG